MAWNYRIFHTCYAVPGLALPAHDYSLRETYYHDDGTIRAISSEAARPGGETFTEIRKDHAQMQEAFRQPVLTPQDITGYIYAAHEVPPSEQEGKPT